MWATLSDAGHAAIDLLEVGGRASNLLRIVFSWAECKAAKLFYFFVSIVNPYFSPRIFKDQHSCCLVYV